MNTYIRILITAASLLLGMALMPQVSHAASDMFLKIEGVAGESKDAEHQGEIDVLAWSWQMSQSGSFHVGGGGAGKVNISNILITKYIDSATPKLMLAAAAGQHFNKAILTIRNTGSSQLEYLVIEMNKVLVANIATGGTGGEDRLTETVAFNFAQVKVTYTPQDDHGGGAGDINFEWDIEANAAP